MQIDSEKITKTLTALGYAPNREDEPGILGAIGAAGAALEHFRAETKQLRSQVENFRAHLKRKPPRKPLKATSSPTRYVKRVDVEKFLASRSAKP